jgi:hypothetical protein
MGVSVRRGRELAADRARRVRAGLLAAAVIVSGIGAVVDAASTSAFLGQVTTFTAGLRSAPYALAAAGPEREAITFVAAGATPEIGTIASAGAVTYREAPGIPAGGSITALVTSPDGEVWYAYTADGEQQIGVVDLLPDGTFVTFPQSSEPGVSMLSERGLTSDMNGRAIIRRRDYCLGCHTPPGSYYSTVELTAGGEEVVLAHSFVHEEQGYPGPEDEHLASNEAGFLAYGDFVGPYIFDGEVREVTTVAVSEPGAPLEGAGAFAVSNQSHARLSALALAVNGDAWYGVYGQLGWPQGSRYEGAVARATPLGTTLFARGLSAPPGDIVPGAENEAWVADGETIVHAAPGGTTAFDVNTGIGSLLPGPDGELWFTGGAPNTMYRFATTGAPVAPEVLTGPADTKAFVGETARFAANCNGSPLPTIQWEVSTTGPGSRATYTPIGGATEEVLTLPDATLAMNGSGYRAVCRNAAGEVATAEAELTVSEPLTHGKYTIGSFTPKRGSALGRTSVKIEGRCFSRSTEILFGASEVGVTYESPSSVTATAPAHTSGPVALVAHSACGDTEVSKATTYTYEAPIVEAVTPKQGPPSGGTAVLVSGAGFAAGTESTAIFFGKIKATQVSCASETECTAVVPAGKRGGVNVVAEVAKDKGKAVPGVKYTYE